MAELADDLAAARYAGMLWNTPLSTGHADLLLDHLDVAPASRVLDLGCGWGELLLRAVQRGGAAATETGVDIDPALLERGRGRAGVLGLGDQVRSVADRAASWREPADRVLCVGASHAWSGTREALAALVNLVPQRGRLLFGDGCWERPPTPPAAALCGEDVLPLDVVVSHAVDAGWRVLHLSTADQREWDDFEATWRAGRQQWLLQHPIDDRAGDVRDVLDRQLENYLTGYRGVLGFCYLVLGR